MVSLQNKITSIWRADKEKAIEKKAKDKWFWYVNFENTKVQIDALYIIPEEIAIELGIVCFFVIQKKIRIALVNENDFKIKGYIEKLKWQWYSLNINLCSKESMQKALKEYWKIKKEKIETKIETEESEWQWDFFTESVNRDYWNVQDLLNELHAESIKFRASDIHIETLEDSTKIRFRIDWNLHDYKQINRDQYLELLNIIKHNANLILNINDTAQDWKYSYVINWRNIEIRVSILPTEFWESLVLRVLDSKRWIIKLDEIWLLPIQFKALKNSLKLTNWIILVGGPTWSWKTTTLYSILNVLNSNEKKLITLEDPVEYNLPWIVQSQISNNFNFADWLKACLRHDPDIIMLWEIREIESAKTAMQAAITWHQVLSTIHTNSALESLIRLKDLWIENYLITSSLNLIIWQRLVRKLCTNCAIKWPVKKETTEIINSMNLNLWIDISEIQEEYTSKWCEKCWNTWFHWREVVAEILGIDENIKNLIFLDAKVSDFKDYINSIWFISIQASAIVKAIKWITTFNEAFKIII